MKKLRFLTLFLFFSNFAFSQVPAGQEQLVPGTQSPSLVTSDDPFVGTLFSDPSELEMVEGLDDPLERVKLRDQDTNLILDMLQSITGRYILRPQNLPQVKINFDSMNVLTKRETLLALESLLAMNGIGITKIDSQFFKAVPASGMNIHVPIWLETPAASLPPSQRIYVKMFYLKYIPAEKMREILNPFATPSVSSLLIFPNANSIMITDSLVNLQRMEKIIDKTDFSKDESKFVLEWYEPKRFSAEVLREEFESKYEAFFKTDFHVKPEFTVPESNDQLGIHCHTLDIVRVLKILDKIDEPMLNPIKNQLVPLYHASAESVAKTLESFLDVSTQTKSVSPGKASGGTSNSGSGKASDAHFSPFAKVIADKRSNGCFLSGTAADLVIFNNMIKELDTPLPMARIDTIFVMIDLSTTHMRGIDALLHDVEWNNKEIEKTRDEFQFVDVAVDTDGDNLPDTTKESLEKVKVPYTVPADTVTGGLKIPGLNSGVEFELENWKLQKIKWGQIFSMASERKDVRIFSTPSITVIHGGGEDEDGGGSGKSKIQIMDTRSVGTSRFIRPSPGSDNEEEGSISDRTAKTELTIQNPRIKKNSSDENGNFVPGTVFMSVSITAEKFDETNTNIYQDQSLPSIKTRFAETDLAIRDGQIMVLGGLQEVQLDVTESKYNLLSDIPYFGEKFFSPKNKKFTPTELMIFIRPTIIDPENKLDDFTERNKRILDRMMSQNYDPAFVSPTGKVLGLPDPKISISKPDNPSAKPSL